MNGLGTNNQDESALPPRETEVSADSETSPSTGLDEVEANVPSSDDVEIPDGRTAVQAVQALQHLLQLPRVRRMYPEGHQRIESQLEKTRESIGSLFEADNRPLLVSVVGAGVLVDAVRVEGMVETTASLAFLLRRRKIRGLRILAGITDDELLLLAEIFDTDHREFLATGGVDGFLADREHAHVQVFVREQSASTVQGHGDASECALPEKVLDAIREATEEPEIVERLTALRGALAEESEQDQGGAQVVNGLITDFLAHPDWANVPPASIKDAIQTFLALVEGHATLMATDGAATDGEGAESDAKESFEDDPDTDPLLGNAAAEAQPADAGPRHVPEPDPLGDEIKDVLGGLSPSDLLDGILEDEPPEDEDPAAVYLTNQAVAYERLDTAVGLIQDLGGIDKLTAEFRHSLGKYKKERQQLLVVADIMVRSADGEKYHARREALLDLLTDDRYDEETLTDVRGTLARSLPVEGRFENREDLMHRIFRNSGDGEGFTQYIDTVSDRPEAVRRIIKRIEGHKECFAVLSHILCKEHLDRYHPMVSAAFIEAAKLRPMSFRRWATQDARRLFRSEVWDLLFERGPTLLSPIVKDLLIRDDTVDRNRLIARLSKDGGDYSLRLLVLGLRFGTAPEDTALVQALGSFQQPLAIAALRAIIQRCNTNEYRSEEAQAAIEALHRIGTEESRGLLWEIVQKRTCLLPLYRRELRTFTEKRLSKSLARN